MSQKRLKVTLISKTSKDLSAMAAKICYAQDIDTIYVDESEAERFTNMLFDIGHESPLEHMTFTFLIRGVSRSLTHQLVRHRIASYSQRSQRYVSELDFGYVIPIPIEHDPSSVSIFNKHIENTLDAYSALVTSLMAKQIARRIKTAELTESDDGYAKMNILYALVVKCAAMLDEPSEIPDKEVSMALLNNLKERAKDVPSINEHMSAMEKSAFEDARCVLPNATASDIVVTMNARSLKNFFAERCCNLAQLEIRTMANQMQTTLINEGYKLFDRMGAKCKNLGYCPEGKRSCGLYPLKETVIGTWTAKNERAL